MSCTSTSAEQGEAEEEHHNGHDEKEEGTTEPMGRKDSRVRIAPFPPVVISTDGGNEWDISPTDKPKLPELAEPESAATMDEDGLSTSSSSEGAEYELEEELRRSSEDEIDESAALRRLTRENTRRNSVPTVAALTVAPVAPKADSEEEDDDITSPPYSEYDSGATKETKREPTPPYHVLETTGKDAPSKRPPPPRPTRPPSENHARRPVPPAPSSPPPPTPGSIERGNEATPPRNGAIVVPPPPTTPPPPTPSSRSKSAVSSQPPAPTATPEPPGQLPKILYEEKDAVRHPDMVPILYASSPTGSGHPPPPPPPPLTAPAGDPKRSHSFLNKVGKGMKHLKRRLTSPEAPDPPPSSGNTAGHSGASRSARHAPISSSGTGRMQDNRTMSLDEPSEDRRLGRATPLGGIQTQKNVKPPKPPPPPRPDSSSIPKAKPRLLGGLKDKIVDLEDISCLDSLFPFLFSVSRLPENGAGSDTIPEAVVESCAQAFLAAWTRKWRRRAERDEARGTPGGAFHLGECPLFGHRHPVFEAHLVGEKLVGLPPSRVSIAAHELLPLSISDHWRSPPSAGLAVVAVRCCIPAERLLSQLVSSEEPISPLRRHLSLAVLVLLLACGLPTHVAPSQVMVLLGRHDIRFLVADTDHAPNTGSPSLLQRLAPHLVTEETKGSDLDVALQAFRTSLLPNATDAKEWRRQMAPLLLPRLFQPFSEGDLFAPLLVTLLLDHSESKTN